MCSVKLRHLGEAERGRQQHGTAALPQHPRLGRSEPVPSRAEPSRSTQESLNNSQGQHRTSCFWCTPSSASRQPTEHHGNPSEELGQREPEGKPEEKRGCGHARGGTRGQPLTARGGRAPTAPHGPPRPPTYLRSSGSRRSAAWRTARPPPARTASGRAGTARTLRGAAPGERLSPVSPARCPRVPVPVSPACPGPTLQHLPLAHGGGPAAAQGRAVYPSPWQPGGSRAAEGEGAWPRRRP